MKARRRKSSRVMDVRPGMAVREGVEQREDLPFRNVEALLEGFVEVLRSREVAARRLAEEGSGLGPEELIAEACVGSLVTIRCREARQMSTRWQRRLRCSRNRGIGLVDDLLALRTNAIEREVVIALLLSSLGMTAERIDSVSELVALLKTPLRATLAVLRALEPQARIVRSKLVFVGDRAYDPLERNVLINPGLCREIAAGKGRARRSAFAVAQEPELRRPLMDLLGLMRSKAAAVEAQQGGYGEQHIVQFLTSRLATQLVELEEVLDVHPDWKLSGVRRALVRPYSRERRWAWTTFLALVCKVLRMATGDDDLFKGAGLARLACSGVDQYSEVLSLFMADGLLVREGLIRPTGGEIAGLFIQDWSGVEATEFELTPEAVRRLGLDEQIQHGRGPVDPLVQVVEPRLEMADVVLEARTAQGVTRAIAHARHGRKLMDDWGLGRVIPYGRGVTLLFWGPPGTGKTATAEALAGELGSRLMVVDYAKVISCYLGHTEKNIAAVFDKARRAQAVLLWDEADGMLADRGGATRSWEVSQVNVVLQELERFEGVCILATNRHLTLDAALERRISAKLEFVRPSLPLRRLLWARFLPPELPLDAGVNRESLARWDLSGGEIKNVVINAARQALLATDGHDGSTRALRMADFEAAYDDERRGRWSAPIGARTAGPIGFTIC